MELALKLKLLALHLLQLLRRGAKEVCLIVHLLHHDVTLLNNDVMSGPHVGPEVGPTGVSGGADGALVGTLGLWQMGSEMVLHVAVSGPSLVTLGTLIGLLPCVYPNVVPQSACSGEGLTAQRASVRPHALMGL